MSRKKGKQMHQTAKNTDREIWREVPGDFYSSSIHVTEHGSIGINYKGSVTQMKVETWFKAGELSNSLEHSKMTILEKVCYWYLFQRKVKT